jgi:hypothetical protein
MRSEVTVRLAAGREFRFDLDEVQPMPHDLARWWLDDQFVQLGCEPLRATGKVLMADKVITIAQAAGEKLLANAKWSSEFARATSAALAKPVVRLDVPAMAITY